MALALVVVAGGAVVWATSGDSADKLISEAPATTRTSEDVDPAGHRDALAAAALARQARALSQGSQASYLDVWDDTTVRSQQRAQTTYQNLRALGIDTLSSRYVAAATTLSLAKQRRLGGVAWEGDVEVSYTLRGYDALPARMMVTYTFVQRGGRAYILDARAQGGERAPIWVFGPLAVLRSERTLVAAELPPVAARIGRLLRAAVSDIEAVVPSWDGTLVAFVPSGAHQLEAVLAAAPGSYDNVAAVTTTVDGSQRQAAPVAIVVNASVFSNLGPIGAQVVITHESTHAATGAASVGAPLWVVEGFADYVGVGSVDVPISVSARAVIQDVRQQGTPDSLPTSQDFAASSADVEVAYEQAWLASRLIAQRYGEAALLRFYTQVVRRPDDLAGAFDRLGTSEQQFTVAWRAYLRRLA